MDRPVLRYFGGKFLLAPWIISHFPKHRVYVEPFGGAASVLMQKPRSHAEVYNDLNGEVVNVFRCLQDPEKCAKLHHALQYTPYSRSEFNLSYEETPDPVEAARRTILRSFQGSGGRGAIREMRTGFKTKNGTAGGPAEKGWAEYAEGVADFHKRLMGVVIECKDALEVMSQQDEPGTLHFVDPPYTTDSRGAKDVYAHEMSDDQHAELCIFLSKLTGMVMLCGYDNPIYTALGWHRIDREALADGGRERTESLWLNPAAVSAMPQADLFAGGA